MWPNIVTDNFCHPGQRNEGRSFCFPRISCLNLSPTSASLSSYLKASRSKDGQSWEMFRKLSFTSLLADSIYSEAQLPHSVDITIYPNLKLCVLSPENPSWWKQVGRFVGGMGTVTPKTLTEQTQLKAPRGSLWGLWRHSNQETRCWRGLCPSCPP